MGAIRSAHAMVYTLGAFWTIMGLTLFVCVLVAQPLVASLSTGSVDQESLRNLLGLGGFFAFTAMCSLPAVYFAWRRSLGESPGAALLESEHRLYWILDHSPTLTFLRGRDGRFTYVNRALGEALGRPAAEVVGLRAGDILCDEPASRLVQGAEEVWETREPRSYEEVIVRDGQRRTYLVNAFPLCNLRGEVEGVCGMAFDLTEVKAREASLSAAQEEAVRASASKSEFLSRMSHELRTPLNSILGFAQLLARDDELNEEQAEFTSHILRAGKHLLSLINEVLDIARIESGRLSLSPEAVDLHAAIFSAVELVRPLAAGRNISVSLDGGTAKGLYVQADAQRLNQVLLNLLMNAVQYNRDNGHVRIVVSAPQPRWVRVSIEDTGPGISPDFEKQIYTPFTRFGDYGEIEGTGLGLTLSKGLITAMEGELGNFNNLEEGATFWFELKQAEAQLPDTTAPAFALPVAQAGGGAMILYIEDNPTNLSLVRNGMSVNPTVQIVGAMQGSLGIELAKKYTPSLILLDLNLPDMSGFEVLRRLRAEPETRGIPVCMLTADASRGQRESAQSLGADEYLVKPYDIEQFLTVVQRFLGSTLR